MRDSIAAPRFEVPARRRPRWLFPFALATLFFECNARHVALHPGPSARDPIAGPLAAPLIEPVELPDGQPGIGFDDMQWSAALARVIVPGGRSGNVYLIDPDSLAVTIIRGLSASTTFERGHDFGATSAIEADGFLYATDRTTGELVQIDLKTQARTHALKLRGHPDYVRFVASRHELWVSEPGSAQIEIVGLGPERPPAFKASALIAVPGGPESLVIDSKSGRAYTNGFAGTTFTLDLSTRKPLSRVKNGCARSLGLIEDEPGQHLFVACALGEIIEIAVGGGAILARREVGPNIDIISYDPTHARVFAASATTHRLDVLKVSAAGELSTEYVAPSASSGSCVVADAKGRAWLCDPARGRVLRVTLPNPR